MQTASDSSTKKWAQKSGYQVKAGKLLRVETLTDFEKRFVIELPGKEALGHDPGQFVMISVPGVGEAPISICSSPTRKESFDLVIRRAGAVTGALHDMDEGAVVGIRGPFGRGFSSEMLSKKDLLFIGGGCGNIPLHGLIQFVLENRKKFGKISILVGCKSPELRLFTDELEKWKNRDDIYFDETVDFAHPGWKGKVGLITTLISKVPVDPKNTYAVVVGPPIMYRFVLKELVQKQIPEDHMIVSLERHMKCGVGKCGHCQISDYYCCQDGPVFTYAEIKDRFEALT